MTMRCAHFASEHNQEAVEKPESPSEDVVTKSVITTLSTKARNRK
jgi:hypothetical protein